MLLGIVTTNSKSIVILISFKLYFVDAIGTYLDQGIFKNKLLMLNCQKLHYHIHDQMHAYNCIMNV